MEVMAELNTEFFDDSAPAVGPGGLVNLSRVSRDLSKGQSTKDEALRALPPPPPPPQKKRSDLYGPGPDVDGLRRRLDPDRAGPGPLARDFGAAVVCARAAGGLEDRGDLYLGVFGTWFACRDAGVAKLD
ncbi:hypothetical protein JL722_5577 [Aureococcus anophagefferens]|nr:hypothetical protein JL722_5577 [Aureococcus anophagefferens]